MQSCLSEICIQIWDEQTLGVSRQLRKRGGYQVLKHPKPYVLA